jgi:anti-sigma-K factor RskA
MNDATSREQMMELVALYALGVLPREEAALVTAFIANDSAAAEEYRALRAGADALAYSADEPVDSGRSARMKERLLARVGHEAAAGGATSRRRGGTTPGWLLGTGLAAAAALVFSVVTVVQDVSLRGDLAQAQQRAASLTAQLAEGERVGQHDRQMVTDLVASDAHRYDVAQGAVVVRGDRVYFALSRLPALPKGKVYQAWVLPKGAKTVQPSVTFVPNADGIAVVAVSADAAKLGAVALSVEPEGGSKAPTSRPTFVRPLS